MDFFPEWPMHKAAMLEMITAEVVESRELEFGQNDAVNAQRPQRKSVQLYAEDLDFVSFGGRKFLEVLETEVISRLETPKNRLTLVRTSIFIDPPHSDPQTFHIDINPANIPMRYRDIHLFNLWVPLLVPRGALPTLFQFNPPTEWDENEVGDNDLLVFDGETKHRGQGNPTDEVRAYLMIVYASSSLLLTPQGQKHLSEQYNNRRDISNPNTPVGYWLGRLPSGAPLLRSGAL